MLLSLLSALHLRREIFVTKSSSPVQCGSRYQVVAASNIVASNCLFSSLSSASSYGGAICINDSSSNFTLLKSAFLGCYSSVGGGGLYFLGVAAKASMLYAVDCCTPSSNFYQSMYFSSRSNSSFCQSSISRCSNSTNIGGYYAFDLENSRWTTTLINSTYNTASIYGSGAHWESVTDLEASYYNVINTTVSSVTIVFFWEMYGSGIFEYSNVIGNVQGTNSCAIVWNNDIITGGFSDITVRYSVLFDNSGAPLLATDRTATMEVIGCWIRHSTTIVSGGAVTSGCNVGTTSTISVLSTVLSAGSILFTIPGGRSCACISVSSASFTIFSLKVDLGIAIELMEFVISA